MDGTVVYHADMHKLDEDVRATQMKWDRVWACQVTAMEQQDKREVERCTTACRMHYFRIKRLKLCKQLCSIVCTMTTAAAPGCLEQGIIDNIVAALNDAARTHLGYDMAKDRPHYEFSHR